MNPLQVKLSYFPLKSIFRAYIFNPSNLLSSRIPGLLFSLLLGQFFGLLFGLSSRSPHRHQSLSWSPNFPEFLTVNLQLSGPLRSPLRSIIQSFFRSFRVYNFNPELYFCSNIGSNLVPPSNLSIQVYYFSLNLIDSLGALM